VAAGDRFAAFEHVRHFPGGTRTAQDAAAAIGCEVGQICKSLVFRVGDEALLVVTSGVNRVRTDRLRLLGTGEARFGARKADAGFVRETTGFSIGGVPPFGHRRPIETIVDEDLLGYDVVWAAAGTPTAVFPIKPADLVERCGGRVERVRS